ncbi:uncharacterized protein LOC128199747 [Bicyclus anynana]|uniref:Uncharacterized protein LOC128199747 n=1 Tax=Bicyclus anynana TaxID=110368 RepID=A0ABM3M5R2_BICAN|nr:uncharacterized protein LOC128199747 [Bicyclus anynana]
MDNILQLLKKIQEDLNETKESVRNSEINLLNKINETFDHVQSKLQSLEDTVSSQEQRLDLLEKRVRERNIVIFGVQEKERNYDELNKIILDLFNDVMKISCTDLDIQSLRRIGKKSEKIRPVIVTFSTLKRKIEILRNKKSLETQNCYIKEDFPPNILAKRRELQNKAKEEREKGKKVFIKYDKLIIIPPKEATNRANKRNHSGSPPEKYTRHGIYNKESTQIQKKNTLTSYWNNKHGQTSTRKEKFSTADSATASCSGTNK